METELEGVGVRHRPNGCGVNVTHETAFNLESVSSHRTPMPRDHTSSSSAVSGCGGWSGVGRRVSLWGRGSLRASLCCPGCGLWGDGGMCELCRGGLGDGDTVNLCSTHGANSYHHDNFAF